MESLNEREFIHVDEADLFLSYLNMTTVEENPLNLSPPEKKETQETSLFAPLSNINSTYLIIGIGLIALIIVAVYYLYHRSQLDTKTKLEEANSKGVELLERNRELQQQISQLQIDNENYVQHIDRLAAQLEQQQQTQIYSPITPMTENSFDAPDPNAVQQKPQIIKDKEEIKKMVNSKRETVQDEVDRRKQQSDTNASASEKETLEELKQITNTDEQDEQPDDDNNVQALMNIIQTQNEE